jgi:hypothetical protein
VEKRVGRRKEAKFIELTETRVNRILDGLESPAKLSNIKNYHIVMNR